MASLTALDDYLASQVRLYITTHELSVSQAADALGIGTSHLRALLDRRSGFTSRDIMLLGAAGFDIYVGACSDRKGMRHVRPMAFVPEEGVEIERSGEGYPAGIDIHCEDVDGEPCTVKLSTGVMRAIVRWAQEHDTQ